MSYDYDVEYEKWRQRALIALPLIEIRVKNLIANPEFEFSDIYNLSFELDFIKRELPKPIHAGEDLDLMAWQSIVRVSMSGLFEKVKLSEHLVENTPI